MRYISSDTNIWIDFVSINRLELPFALDFVYCMSSDAIKDELLSPPDLRNRLKKLGLSEIEIDDEEFSLVLEYGTRYVKLSVYDRMALAVAKKRQYILLSGDGALRKAAVKEGVEVRGSLWIFDQLLENGKITIEEYRSLMITLRNDTTGMIRLPHEEIRKRIERR